MDSKAPDGQSDKPVNKAAKELQNMQASTPSEKDDRNESPTSPPSDLPASTPTDSSTANAELSSRSQARKKILRRLVAKRSAGKPATPYDNKDNEYTATKNVSKQPFSRLGSKPKKASTSAKSVSSKKLVIEESSSSEENECTDRKEGKDSSDDETTPSAAYEPRIIASNRYTGTLGTNDLPVIFNNERSAALPFFLLSSKFLYDCLRNIKKSGSIQKICSYL